MLNGIHLVDFGNHRNTRLTFGPMTALVGQNGSGKTTVMRALREVGAAWIGTVDTAINPWFFRRGSNQAAIAASWPEAKDDVFSDYALYLSSYATWVRRLRLQRDESPIWIPDPRSAPPKVSEVERVFEMHQGPKSPPAAGEVRISPVRIIESWTCRYFKTSASSLQRPAVADPKETVLNSDGSNLAWALASLMTEEPDRFQRIVDALREVVPIVRSIRSKAVALTQTVKQTITINKRDRAFDEEREVNGQELIFDMKSGKGLSAYAVSEGTLVVLAVLTLLHGSDADLIMLDDVELGLHPKAQRDLIRQLRQIQQTHPKLQILVSTHSPYVVDEFKAEDVWVFAPDAEGCAVTKRLSDHPDAKRALEVLTTGEFWSAEGEPWVLDQETTSRVAEEPGV